jgi:hypothetical protein
MQEILKDLTLLIIGLSLVEEVADPTEVAAVEQEDLVSVILILLLVDFLLVHKVILLLLVVVELEQQEMLITIPTVVLLYFHLLLLLEADMGVVLILLFQDLLVGPVVAVKVMIVNQVELETLLLSVPHKVALV